MFYCLFDFEYIKCAKYDPEVIIDDDASGDESMVQEYKNQSNNLYFM